MAAAAQASNTVGVQATAQASVHAAALASSPYGALFDPRSLTGSEPLSLAQSFPLELDLKPRSTASTGAEQVAENEVAENETIGPAPADLQFGESVPLPVPRPAELGSLVSRGPLPAPSRRFAQQDRRAVAQAAPADNRSFFDKLFGPPAQTSGPVLAYASPEDSGVGNARAALGNAQNFTLNPAPRYDRQTAVYDIASHTVYMPNGTRLEAHSGLGSWLDDPGHVNERMRGATPPNVYQLQPREALFHGVPALRLIPVGGGTVYGRSGLLAHTYMLGPNGASNGCVSFRNYSAFLQAYRNGEIKRLAVVARVN